MNKNGFSLLSFVVYLMLFSLITFFSCHIIISLILPSCASLRRAQSLIALHVASDFFVRDAQTINDVSSWQSLEPHQLIWQNNGESIGWSFDKGRLMRRIGIYDHTTWREARPSMVAKNLTNVTFTAERNQLNKIIGIELVMVSSCASEKPVVCYVAITKNKSDGNILIAENNENKTTQ